MRFSERENLSARFGSFGVSRTEVFCREAFVSRKGAKVAKKSFFIKNSLRSLRALREQKEGFARDKSFSQRRKGRKEKLFYKKFFAFSACFARDKKRALRDIKYKQMTDNLSEYLNRPLAVGNKSVEKRLVLSPMTFLGHVAFRELLSAFGGYGLLFAEMCSAKSIPHENRYISPYFRWRDEEISHLVCQIFGDDPEIMAKAARRIEKEGFFGVDINFGCSAGVICHQNGGAAVLKQPDLAAEIVAAVRQAVSCPVFVKFRTGWQDDPQAAVALAKRFEDAGADALTFHPRVAPDRRSRPPKWEYIRMVKEAVSVPVFGNGDVFDRNDCRKMLETTGCDGIALGRIAVAKPWIFSLWTGGAEPGLDIYLDSAIRLTSLLTKHYDPTAALRRFKKFALYFSANFRFGHTLCKRIRKAQDMEQIKSVLYDFFKEGADVAARPNMNFFA